MNVRKELEKHGCIYTGHFVGVSGKHLAGYCNIDPILPHTSTLNKMTKFMVKPFAEDDVDTVVAPAIGAIPLTQWGPHHLEKMTKKKVIGVWADKVQPKGFKFERSGFLEAIMGKRILILEDIINQMHSIKEMVNLVREEGGIIVGGASIVANKGVSAEAIGIPKLVTLADVHYDVWAPEDCPKNGLCSKNVPIIVDVGHGDEYREKHPKYVGGYTTILAV